MKEHLILVLAMVALLVATATGGTYSGGTGEPNDPYRIATAEDLNDIGKYEEDWDKHFILTNDVNLAEYTGTQFNIIGRWTDWDDPNNKPFTGIFDGNDNRIWNFTWTSGVRDGIGLFRYVGYYAQIKNLGMENANVDVGTIWRVGGLVAINWGGKITNCYSTGSISGDGYVGGLVGENYGVISDCYSTCDVSGGQVSGLVGGNWGTITNCYSTGSITGSGGNGGLVGYNGAGAITNCYSTGSVSGLHYVAGLVAENFAGTITNSYSTGSVSGLDTVGGLVGGNSLGTITDCYSTCSVSGGLWDVGGLVGTNIGAITNCYSTGSVGGRDDVGGLVGYNPEGTVTASFWDIETSDRNTSAGGTPKTTGEMKTIDTFTDAGWDFVEIWGIGENQTYPFLRTEPAGDLSHDKKVDFVDLAIFAINWLATNSP